jgi:hypothetical protein
MANDGTGSQNPADVYLRSVQEANNNNRVALTDPTYGAGPNPVGYSGTWNVHDEYNWALNLGNKDDIRKYIPVIEMKEYNLTSSSQLNAFKLFLSQTQNQLDIAGISRTGLVGTTTTSTANIATFIAEKLIPNKGAVDAYLGPEGGDVQPGGFSNSNPYYGLYQGKETGNEYHLPYLNPQNMTSNLGTWKGIDGSEIAKGISSAAGTAGGLGIGLGQFGVASIEEFQKLGLGLEAISNVASVGANLAGTPGISKETIKAYTPNETGDAITTTFYLFNTENVADIGKNWKFLYTLTYQNLPDRRSLSRMDPPCIYDVTVPGFKRFPVAVISNLKVDNVGTTRLVDITTGEMTSTAGAKNANVNVKIIPEAYKVTLTIQSLLTNTRNLFKYSYDTSFGSQITVITAGETKLNTAKTSPQPPTDTKPDYRTIPQNNPNGVNTD